MDKMKSSTDDSNTPPSASETPEPTSTTPGEAERENHLPEISGERAGDLQELRDRALGFIETRPGLALAVALGAGFLAGKLFARMTR